MYFRSLPVMMDSGFTNRHNITPARKMIVRMMAEELQTKANHTTLIGKQMRAMVSNSIIDAMRVFIGGNVMVYI